MIKGKIDGMEAKLDCNYRDSDCESIYLEIQSAKCLKLNQIELE